MSNCKAETTLNEKDSLQDLLNLEKTLVKVYGECLTEGASKGFRETVTANLNETAKDQMEVFLQMTEHGYYQVQSAQETQLSKTKNQFNKIKSQLN